jgi:hypothetical protein
MAFDKLSVGDIRKDRRGYKWAVVRHDKDFRYPFVAVNALGLEMSYAEDGRWSFHCATEYDLVG